MKNIKLFHHLKKTQAVFPPLFESINESGLRALESILGETGSVRPCRLAIRFFVAVGVPPLRATDTSNPLYYMTDHEGILFPTGRRFVTDSGCGSPTRSATAPSPWKP